MSVLVPPPVIDQGRHTVIYESIKSKTLNCLKNKLHERFGISREVLRYNETHERLDISILPW